MNHSVGNRLFQVLRYPVKIIFSKLHDGMSAVSNLIEGYILRLKLRLRHKLLILFFIITLPSLIFIVVSFAIITKTVSSQMNSFQKAVVTSAHKLVEHYIINCQKSLITLASEKNFRYAVSAKKTDLVDLNLKRVFIKHKNFNFLGVVRKKDDKLYMLAGYPSSYKALTGDEDIYDYLKFNFSNPRARVSNAYEFKQKKEVVLVYPLKGALLIGGVNLENLSQLLKKIKPIEESNFIVLDPDCGVILGGEGRFEHELLGKEGMIRLEEKKSLAYYAQNQAIKWWVILSSPYSVIYRSSIYMRSLGFLFIILGIVTAFLLALYFSKRVTLPIAFLNKGARILGEGNLSYRIELKTGDELEELANEFNRMGGELEKSYNSMGQKIKNATRDLKDAYIEIEDKNKAIQKADRLKSAFLASMSHELRTPMNAIIGFTSLLHDGTYGKVSKKQKNTYEKIMRNTKHLLNLINDILDLSKIEAGRMRLEPETIKLNLLLNDLSEEIKPLAAEKKLDFILETDHEIECYQDYTRLRQVVMNLVSNAIKFTMEGEVRIKTGKLDESFFIKVKDTGIGIKEEDIRHIFDEFVQADGSITREFEGTGLGLSISRKLVEMMGGRIEVESRWGEGTAFEVILPYKMK